MKIKNEYVKINIGKKNISFKNTILDKYLKALASSQIKDIGRGHAPILDACYLRFGNKLIFDEETELFKRHFNLKCTGGIIDQSYNEDIISTTYKYDTSNLSQYLDKEITAVGFFEDEYDECLACIDTYGLGLTIDNINNFYIERKDTLETNLKLYINHNGFHTKGINSIIHLLPGANKINGIDVDIYLQNIYEGNKCYGNIGPRSLAIDGSEIEKGILKIDNTMHNEYKNGLLVPSNIAPDNSLASINEGYQKEYIYLLYIPYNHETGESISESMYYVRFKDKINIIGDYKIELKYERS